MTAPRPRIIVVGNVNMDVLVRAPRIPEPGENLRAEGLAILPGGKAANQAVAAARLGAHVRVVACVGGDALSAQALANMKNNGIDVSLIRRETTQSCGIAIVVVDPASGQNRILSAAGANSELSRSDLEAAADAFDSAQAVLVQLGVPKAAVEAAIEQADRRGMPCVLDPTPLAGWLPANWNRATVLLPNESELGPLCADAGIDLPPTSGWTGAGAHAFAGLRERGWRGALVLKLGAQGCVVYDDLSPGGEHFPAATGIQVVDTTGAGDAFAGGLAVQWVRAEDLRAAVRFATAVAGLATTRLGAQAALPTLAEVNTMMPPAEVS